LAQGACKNAIFMAQKSVDGLLKKLKSADMVTSAKSKVEVYNGYGYAVVLMPYSLCCRYVKLKK